MKKEIPFDGFIAKMNDVLAMDAFARGARIVRLSGGRYACLPNTPTTTAAIVRASRKVAARYELRVQHS